MGALHVGGFSSLSALLTQSKQASSSVTSTTTTTTTTTETVTTTLSQEPPMDMENRRQHINEEMQKDDHLLERKVEGSNSIDHFILLLDDTGTVYDVRGTEDYDTESGQILADTIAASKKNDGYCDSLQYVKLEYEEGAVIVCSDRLSDRTMLKNLLLISIAVFILMEGIVLLLTMVLTKRAMRPVQVSFEKQQQFISDAGHELKTPLTIISANTDILMDEIGENKWLTYIKSQTERMRILVQEMMDLTKLSNNSDTLIRSHFNISSLVENVALPFECQAFEQHKKFDIDTQPDIMFFGNTEQIRRMIGIFIDNAFKYSNENGTIQVQLKMEGGKKILKIYNTGVGIQKGEEEKIFERFYRSDASRSRQTGGYGLGLAIAKKIADQHHIKIQVLTEPNQWICFQLTL
jgi:signal transduction histidine kinase